MKSRAWAEINLNHLRHNAKVLKKLLPPKCEVMAVVKANAYGHGDAVVAKELNLIGISAFAVAAIREGVHLRRQGITGEILILGYTSPEEFADLVRYDLTQTVVDCEYGKLLDQYGRKIKVHVKIDTGMHRLGEDYQNVRGIAGMFACKNLSVEGIFTHLGMADDSSPAGMNFSRFQIDNFYGVLAQLRDWGYDLPNVHIQSSYGVLNFPELQCDYARIGIALYGVLSTAEDQTKLSVDLRPVLSLKARVALTKEIGAGETVGYGCRFTAPYDMTIAVVSIGYADGFPRCLSCGGGYVLVKGKKAPVIGRICMDQLMIDCSGIPDVRQNDIVTLIGEDGTERITAEQVAKQAGTITNELCSRLGNRLERVYVSD